MKIGDKVVYVSKDYELPLGIGEIVGFECGLSLSCVLFRDWKGGHAGDVVHSKYSKIYPKSHWHCLEEELQLYSENFDDYIDELDNKELLSLVYSNNNITLEHIEFILETIKERHLLKCLRIK